MKRAISNQDVKYLSLKCKMRSQVPLAYTRVRVAQFAFPLVLVRPIARATLRNTAWRATSTSPVVPSSHGVLVPKFPARGTYGVCDHLSGPIHDSAVVPDPLTENEERIFDFLRRVSKFVGYGGLNRQHMREERHSQRAGRGRGKDTRRYPHAKSKVKAPVLRVAGGWVRDKFLGRGSNDIDIVIDSMTGAQFAHATRAYEASLVAKARREGKSYQRLCDGAVTVIKENPEQSKHLETAMITICGLPIDFAHLRTEVYDISNGGNNGGSRGGPGGGRIPTRVAFGSPEDDTLRRDFTMNSLFFNVNSGNFEDFTPGSSGVHDLRRGVLRTPRQCLAGNETRTGRANEALCSEGSGGAASNVDGAAAAVNAAEALSALQVRARALL